MYIPTPRLSPARRQWLQHLLAMFLLVGAFAVPATATQYLGLQTTLAMNRYRDVVMDKGLNFDASERLNKIEQAYYSVRPWEDWQRVTGLGFTVACPFLCALLSLAYLCRATGALQPRFKAAMGLAAAFSPIFILWNMPWGLYYWVGDDWAFAIPFTLMICGATFTVAAIFNGMAIAAMRIFRRRA